MDIQNKTNEELNRELSKLRQEIDSLKVKIEKSEEALHIAKEELLLQKGKKGKRAGELNIDTIKNYYQNGEKEKQAIELSLANTKLAFQNEEKRKRAAELIIANIELAFTKGEKGNPPDEISTASKELAFIKGEKAKQAEELIVAKIKNVLQGEENEKIAAELIIANLALALQVELIAAREMAEGSENRFKVLYENTPVSYQSLDTNACLIHVNPAWLQSLGYKREEVIGRPFTDFMTPESAKLINEQFPSFIEKGEIRNYEFEMIRKDGARFTVSYDGKIGYDELGNFNKTHCIFTDITNRKLAEQGLKDSNERWKSLFKDIPNVAVQGYDKNGITKYWNKASETLYGYSAEEAIGDTLINLIIPEDLKISVCEAIKEMFTSKINIPAGELKLKRKDGSTVIVFSSHTFVQVSGQEPEMYCIDIDLSGRKKAELELVKAKEKAEESDRLKSAFLANMSHEIRTPMNGILGFSELLKTPNLSGDEQQLYISVIEKSGKRMLNIINDIVNISKIESGLMEVRIEESNINEQIEYIYKFFKPEADEKGIGFSVKESLPSLDAIINTDREKLYAILTNLVKNAIKFTDKGSIEFGCHKKDEILEFYIKDTGIGIPIDLQEAIFERFIQADITGKMARQGAGLGLSISRAYVEMLGGKLWVESDEENLSAGNNGGSVFFFTLPNQIIETSIEGVTENDVLPIAVDSNKKLKILIADDDESSELIMSIAIKEFASEIIIARNGLEAVEACRKNPDIDLILMDMQMPEMSGFEATAQIRKFNTTVHIIAQTAYALSGDKEKMMAAGCNDYISKPIKVKELQQLISIYSTIK